MPSVARYVAKSLSSTSLESTCTLCAHPPTIAYITHICTHLQVHTYTQASKWACNAHTYKWAWTHPCSSVTCTHICAYKHTHAHTHWYMYIPSPTCKHMHASMHTHTDAHMCTNVHTKIFVLAGTITCMRTCKHTSSHSHTLTHMDTHTYMCTCYHKHIRNVFTSACIMVVKCSEKNSCQIAILYLIFIIKLLLPY